MSVLEQLLTMQRDPRTPQDELHDVNAEVMRTFTSGLGRSDFADQSEILDALAYLKDSDAALQKAVVLQPGVFERAYPTRDGYAERREGHQSILYVNELGVIGPTTGEPYAEKPEGGGFQFLKYLAGNLDVFQALLYTRTRQVTAFCRPYDENDDNPLGYRFVRRDGEKLTPDDEKETQRLARILENCGTEFDPVARHWDLRRRTFRAFTEALVADSLIADSCPVEIVETARGQLAGWHNIPFDTVRLAFESGYRGDDRIVAVQLHPSDMRQPWIGLERDEIVFEVRNPRADLYYGDYGAAELEHFTRAATAYLNGFTFNASALDRKSVPRGLLTLFGNYDRRQLNEFRAQWNALARGAANQWALPVLVSQNRQEGGAVYTPVDAQSAEMYAPKFMIFVMSILCALFGMDPIELNMESFTSKQSTLSGKDTAEKLQSSRDRGLIPLMSWYDRWLNDNIIQRLTKRFLLTWVGLHPADEERKHEREKLSLTIDELREKDGVDPHPDPDLGAAPANPALMSVYVGKLQQQQMEAMGGGAGGGGPAWDLPDSEKPLPYAREDGGAPPKVGSNAGASGASGPASGARPALAAPRPQLPAPTAARAPTAPRAGFAKAAAPRLIVEIRDLGPGEWEHA